MKKAETQIMDAIRVTKKYTPEEVQQLGGLFTYLNNINIEEEEFKTGISAKGLWKLLSPLTRTGKVQKFDDWWQSVSNTARLKEDEDYERVEDSITKDISNKPSFAISENSEQAKRGGNTGSIPVREVDFILTLRAGEYCAVLTKGDSGDLYRRFIFDIKDEFLRLVFRFGKSIETRNKFTNSIGNLDWMKELGKEKGSIYGEMTNLLYLIVYGVKANEFKVQNNIPNKEIARHYFTKDGLFNIEELENDLGVIIKYQKPKNREELKILIQDFLREKETELSTVKNKNITG